MRQLFAGSPADELRSDTRFVVEAGLFRLHVDSTLERTQSVELLVR